MGRFVMRHICRAKLTDSRPSGLPSIGGPAGTKDAFPPMRASFSLGVPGVAAVVALRHPLLDGHTFVVMESVPVKERMRSGKHSARNRYPEFRIFRRPFGPQPQVCWTFVMCLRFLRALP